ncbi:cysteine-rich protein 2-binding protein isoform X2 [Monomorium pharaonis]|uniref:cysteine-rich protein 2-binding protein isoform X2 n=1 Tax=Monomorium pharaonis TaxID=307658 RepID=UPI00174739BF|nr:cysteine-rich protein 2-binding protein isoform X2 [Monomorium pharaonis]
MLLLINDNARKKKKNWIGTISGTLSHYSSIFFKSGTNELGESGWWKLLGNDPPEVLIAKNNKVMMDRKKHVGAKSCKSSDSPVPSDSSLSIGEDSNSGELFKNKSFSMYTHAYVQPTETLSDFLFEEDELNDMDLEDDIMLRDENDVPFISNSIRDCQAENSNLNLVQLMDNWLNNTSNTLSPNSGDEIKRIKEERYDEDSNDSPVSMSTWLQEQPPVSWFKETKRRPRPWAKSFINNKEEISRMTRQEEIYMLQRIDKNNLDKASTAIRRLYRKLAVRKTKREYRLPLLDVDCFGPKSGAFVTPLKSDRVLDRFFSDDLRCIFEHRLQGYNEPTSVHSPYTNRLLKPFIRRATDCQPLWLRIMEELCAKVNRNNPQWKAPARASIDYSYVRPQHIPAINSLCCQFFWPGIDLTECLQYPDFTCVVLYKKLIIGFAILVPYVGFNEAYISFFFTRPEWRRSGIGTFMLYHLIQTCMGRDVTLHVSATNSALILYQKFGFKVEEFIQDFYDKYLPSNSQECKHALFLRLSR